MTSRDAGCGAFLLLIAAGTASAQESGPTEGSTTNLPAITVDAPARARHRAEELGPAGHAGPQTSAVTRVTIYSTSPLASSGGGNGGDPDKVPGTVTTVDARQIERLNSLNVTDALQQYVPGVMVSSVSGNPFQPDVQFRGFTASPVSGTPQGLAVYQNGVRINEAFGDTVNWDLIPTAAIASVTMVTNNPAFGLNALGGALDVQMKNGFNYHGAEVDVMGGSFGRIQSSLQWGKQVGNFAVYGALEGAHDDGFRLFSASNIRRFYGDVGYRNTDSEIHLNLGAADNNFGAAAAVPIELLNTNYSAVYTTPQTSTNQVGYGNLTGKFDVSPTWTVDGNLHYRAFSQHTQDGNPTNAQACTANPNLLCYNDGSTPAYGQNGQQLSNPFPANAFLGENDRTSTATTTFGTTLQATNTDKIFGFDNRFTVGASFDRSITHFSANAELGTFGNDYVLNGSGLFLGSLNSADGPVGVRTVNQYTGLYALDAIDLTNKLTVTGGGRFNFANVQIQDMIGGPASSLNGTNDFSRFNPLIGATYKITSGLTAYGGYSEANRAPTPLELGCANPAQPCILATFLVSDPPLQQVVSRTFEAGFRGRQELGPDLGTVTWKFGGFRATNTNDILSVPAPNNQGFGYFANVGSTRRQGIEAEAKLTNKSIEMYATYAFIDARFLDSLQLASNSPFANANGNIQVSPGDQIPTIPRHRVKFGIDYAMTDALKVGADMVYVSSQYFVGDASNQASKLPGYAVVNLHSSYQINRNWQVYGRIDNLLNNHYATYGIFFDKTQLPNFVAGGASFSDPRSLSPARPQAAYVGVKATF
ncbi:MAG: TonB-dependent receptor [Xanthobacteraceae bacterium]|nr:TonB-dependent receptor [Xanthobacteraceae bacterium]